MISAQEDWLDHETLTIEQLFEKIVPTPEQGDNSMRGEIIAAAFASDISTFDGQAWTCIRGEATEPTHLHARKGRRAVVFRLG